MPRFVTFLFVFPSPLYSPRSHPLSYSLFLFSRVHLVRLDILSFKTSLLLHHLLKLPVLSVLMIVNTWTPSNSTLLSKFLVKLLLCTSMLLISLVLHVSNILNGFSLPWFFPIFFPNPLLIKFKSSDIFINGPLIS